VLLAANPERALDRFRQQPYDALIVDANTVGEDGLDVFERVLNEAHDRSLRCVGILLLSPEQSEWTGRVSRRANSCVMMLPVGFKQLRAKLRELMGE
jgi:DNA-binding response OmpR family regulator